MRENENRRETLKCLRVGFFFLIFLMVVWYIVFGLNEFQWVFN